MSRIAKAPISVPKGISVEISNQEVRVKGSKGNLSWIVHPKVRVAQNAGELAVTPVEETKEAWAQAGTMESATSR